jgi:hypothetical protein
MALTERVWPPGTANVPDTVLPLRTPDIASRTKHGDPLVDTSAVIVLPDWARFASMEPLRTYTFDDHVPCQ